MTHAQELTRLYRQFYRRTKPNSNSTLRPIAIAARAILDADPRLFDSAESLVEVVNAEVRSFMDRVGRGSADGRFAPGSDWQSRERAMHEFAQYFVQEIYWNVLGHDPASLRGKQLNLLKNACELVYVNEDAEERRRRGAAQEAQEQE